ncbi:MAG: hypothetical protein Q8Q23_03560 [bacterium]|nr:hypothetical protein [bacterium]
MTSDETAIEVLKNVRLILINRLNLKSNEDLQRIIDFEAEVINNPEDLNKDPLNINNNKQAEKSLSAPSLLARTPRQWLTVLFKELPYLKDIHGKVALPCAKN